MNFLGWFWLIASAVAVLLALYTMTVLTGLADRVGKENLGKDEFRVSLAVFGLLYVVAYTILSWHLVR